ncbi:hypothetical protein, variant [Aphanomyces invadans]|nr:hypothetical protein, variant [Aphanomyces invadans]ETV94429.1 hypothetical protein, variant [Aphanomyces invadans]|eukprot:XP_008876744.1 hypothetical protein, variant [Aphanomyces invadans]
MELPPTHSPESFLLQATPMTALSIRRGEVCDAVVAADEGMAIVWQFHVLSHDVNFRVLVDGIESPTFTRRIDKMDGLVDGTLELNGRASSVTLQWDNSYSMLRGKDIQYRVMAVPTSTLHVAREAANEYHIKYNHPVQIASRSHHHHSSTVSRPQSMPTITKLRDESTSTAHDLLTQRLESAVVDTVAVFMAQPNTPLHAGSARPLVLALEAILRCGVKPTMSSHPPEEHYFRFLIEARNVLREDMAVVSDAELFRPPPFMRYLGWGRARAFLFFALNRHVLHRALENLIKRHSLVDRYYDSSTALLANYAKAKRAIACLSALYGVSFNLTPLRDDLNATAASFPRNLYQTHAWEPFLMDQLALADGAGDVAYFQGTTNMDDFTSIQDCTPAKYLCLSTPTIDVTVPRGDRICIPLNMHDPTALVAVLQLRVVSSSVLVGFGLKLSNADVAPLRIVEGSPNWVEIILRLEYPISDLHFVLDNSSSLIRAKAATYRLVVTSRERYSSAWSSCAEVAHVICWKHVIQRSLDWSAKHMEAIQDEEKRWLAPTHPPPTSTSLTDSVTSWLGSILLPNTVACAQCMEPFALFRRRQECSICQKGFCLACSRHIWAAKPVCDRCYLRELDKKLLQERAKADNARSNNPALDALRQNTTYDKYFKMLSFGVPPSAIGQKMQQDYIPQDIVDIFVSGLDGAPSTLSRPTSTPSTGGGSRPQLLRKKSTLRKLHWTALDATTKGKATIWNRVTAKRRHAPVALSGADMDRVMAYFGEATATAKRALPSTKSSGKFQSALDSRRTNNIHIGLSRFKSMGPSGLVAALRECNLDLLTPDVLQTLLEIGPTPVELKRYMNFRGAVHKLDEAERFLVDMAKVARVQEKIHVMLFVQQFSTLIDELNDRLRILSVACHQILSSERLPRYFEVILALGNVLNEGTEQANASGVTLASLLKLSETRSIDQSMTLLQFLMQLIHERGEMDLFHVMDELDMLDAAKRFSNVQCVSQMALLQKQLAHLVHEVKEEDTIDRMQFEKAQVDAPRKQRQSNVVPSTRDRPMALEGGHQALMAALRKRTSVSSDDVTASDNGATDMPLPADRNHLLPSSQEKPVEPTKSRGALFAAIRNHGEVRRGETRLSAPLPTRSAAETSSTPTNKPTVAQQPPHRPNNSALLAAIRLRQQEDPPKTQENSCHVLARNSTPPMTKSILLAENRPCHLPEPAIPAVAGRQELMAAIASKKRPALDDQVATNAPSTVDVRSRSQLETTISSPRESPHAATEYTPNAFLRTMGPHVSRIKHELSVVQDKLESMTEHWHEVAVYLGESSATPSDYALGLLHRFMLDVKLAYRALVSKGVIRATSIGSSTNVGDRIATVLGAATVLAQRQRNLEVTFPWAKVAYLQPTSVVRPGDRVVCRQFGRGIVTATR